MSYKRVHVVITGYVQGVGFRASCQRQALAAGVKGWVRNRWDGAVEAEFEGPAAAVDKMVAWCHRGPAQAEVLGVQVTEVPVDPTARGFHVR